MSAGRYNPYSKMKNESSIIQNLKTRVKSLEHEVSLRDEELLKLKNKLRKSRVDELEQTVMKLKHEVC
jgi:predicted nuclease with TOPRIM domain